MQYIVEKKGYRWLPLLALAVAMALLVFVARDTSAVHNEGMLEMDGNVAYDGGFGVDPGASNCPYNQSVSSNAVDCIITQAAFDWADDPATGDQQKGVCQRGSDGYITEASPLPVALAGADVICQPDFIQGFTDDISYHTGSDKDYDDISGPEPVWHCTDSANATSKADLLNAYFISTTVLEGGVPHQVIYIGAERDSEHGDVNNGYWILQDDITVPGSTTTAGQLDCSAAPSPKDFSGQHQCGDLLIRLNYTSGGRIGAILVNEWVAPSPGFTGTFVAANGCDQTAGNADDCTATQQASAETQSFPGGFLCVRPPTQGDCRVGSALAGAADTDDLCGRVNGETNCTIRASRSEPLPPPCSGPGCFSTPWEPGDATCSRTGGVPSPTFSEVGIDLTGLNLEIPCIGTLIAESRSSPSITATLKDFAMAPTGDDCTSELTTEIHAGSNADPAPHTVLTAGTPPVAGTAHGGDTVHDQATLTTSGPSGTAGGTLTFTLFSNTSCDPGVEDGNVISTETVNVSQAIGTTATYESADYTTAVGDTGLSYLVSYSGDSANDIPASGFDCEPLNLINPSTSLVKTAAPTVVTTVVYGYAETNDGDVPLTNPSVTDDVCGTAAQVVVTDPLDPNAGANTGDANGDGILDVGETWNFTCTSVYNGTGTFTNIAIGSALDPLNFTITFCVTPPNGTTICDAQETDSRTVTVDVTVS